ncbi:MFS transporter [Myxococcota bacterium]|nr:MFS transporter [Myxococcota bacterium]
MSNPPQNRRRHAWRNAIGALEFSEFRWVFASNMSFFMAMGAMQIVRPWLAFELTDSPLALGIVSGAVAVPMLLLAPYGGVLADRIERRRLIIISQCIAVLSEGAILALLITDSLQYWHLVGLASLMGCTFPLVMPARQAIVVDIVGKKRLTNAIALNMAGMNVTRVAGPALAGFMIPVLGIEGVYGLNLALYVFAVIAMFRIAKRPAEAKTLEAPAMTNFIEGLTYVRNHKIVLILLIYGLVPMFLAMPFQTLLVVFADDVWETGAVGLGILHAAAGTGGVLGSIFVAAQSSVTQRLRPMMISVLAFGLLLALFAFSPWFIPAVVLILIANIFASIFGTLNNTAIQLLIPDSIRGRISSFLMMSFSLPLLGTLPISTLAESYGAPMAVGGAAILAMASALFFYAVSPALRSLDFQIEQLSEDT